MVDVVKLIKHHQLPREYSKDLAEEVRDEWSEKWTDQQD